MDIKVGEEIAVPELRGLGLGSKELSQAVNTQLDVPKDGLKRLSFDDDSGMDGHDRPSPIALPAKDGMAGPSLPDLEKPQPAEDTHQLPGGNGRKPLPHLNGNGNGRNDGLGGPGYVQMVSLSVLNIGLDSVLDLYQGFFNRFSLYMAALKGGAIRKIASFLTAFHNNRIIQDRALPSHDKNIVTGPPMRVKDAFLLTSRILR